MSKQESKRHGTTGSFRLLSRNLAREPTDAELNAIWWHHIADPLCSRRGKLKQHHRR
ncbi:hypothetical protein FHR47_003886 [Xanthomonas arboricola]|uniref:hypothetical protein n=1 Tax=Xanthomonas euroxanthea TaxID=2259622 RepID=UPI001608CFF4|nr:hypothetical protein [Xanthomonas euroxanthea]MBB3779991.1 hypothetical protein [Xanthomonas euroxanthea]MBB3803571.1 hypothetical protein [Xanthomonas cannabis]